MLQHREALGSGADGDGALTWVGTKGSDEDDLEALRARLWSFTGVVKHDHEEVLLLRASGDEEPWADGGYMRFGQVWSHEEDALGQEKLVVSLSLSLC